MLRKKSLGAIALVGLLAGAAANADHRRYSGNGDYRSEPQIRLGIDVLWGGYGYAPPPPPVVWYPARYAPRPVYERGYERPYGRAKGWRHRHDRHRHRTHRGEYCDD